MSKLDDVIANQEYVIDCLKALRNIHQTGCCNDCAVRKCQYAPKPGQIVRYNCVFYERIENGSD